MTNLRITTVQSELHWEDIKKNQEMFSAKLNGLKGQTDLVILPEMFTTGFSMQPAELAEEMSGSTLKWMEAQAQKIDAVITGSIIIKENENYYNRLIWMQPDGQFKSYDKRHLFTLANEHHHYQAGQEKIIIEYKGWKICPLICYDLRFPVWSRNRANYDLLFYVANWPAKRADAWSILLQARAIENQAYTIGVNRSGTDGKDLYYSGRTSVTDYAGKRLYEISDVEDVFTIHLSKEKLIHFREKLNFLPDQDNFDINL